jgi:predicted GNAT family N-acyltransferase
LSADCRLSVTLRPARDAAEVEAAKGLRLRVFCDEQGVAREEELDGLDDAALHLLALDESGVIATCRLRFPTARPEAKPRTQPDGRACKLERMAVEQRLRGLGVGAKLLAAAEEEARARGLGTMVLNAQVRVQDFYASQGYRPEGDRFMEARIEHVRMRKLLDDEVPG